MPSLPTLVTFGAASLALLVIPGPAVLYIVNRSVADGRRVGLAAVAGIEIGSLVHVVAAALGLSAALAASPRAFEVIAWLGAAYLVVLGIRALITRPVAGGDPIDAIRPGRAFAQGVVVNVLNPKVALFFISFLPPFIDPGRGGAGLQSLLLGTLFVGLGTISDSLYSLAASSLRTVLLQGRSLAVARRWAAGAVYIALGVIAARAGYGRVAGV